jgi:hypothetical protein
MGLRLHFFFDEFSQLHGLSKPFIFDQTKMIAVRVTNP